MPIQRASHRLNSWLAPAVLWALLLAQLGGPRGAYAEGSRSVLVLNITEEGRPKEGLRAEVGELLHRAGARVIETPRLPASERSCDESRCLNKLAEEHRVELIVAARIEHRSAHDRIINMWIYDARSGRDQTESEVCDVRDVSARLRDLAGRLIGPLLQEESEPPPGAATGSTAAPPGPPVARQAAAVLADKLAPKDPRQPTARPVGATGKPRLAGWRLGLAVGLGTLAVGSLATAIGLQRLEGQVAGGAKCMNQFGASTDCAYELMPAFTASYVAAGALAVGAVLTLTLPSSKEVRR